MRGCETFLPLRRIIRYLNGNFGDKKGKSFQQMDFCGRKVVAL